MKINIKTILEVREERCSIEEIWTMIQYVWIQTVRFGYRSIRKEGSSRPALQMSHGTVVTPGNKSTSREKLNAYIHMCYTRKVTFQFRWANIIILMPTTHIQGLQWVLKEDWRTTKGFQWPKRVPPIHKRYYINWMLFWRSHTDFPSNPPQHWFWGTRDVSRSHWLHSKPRCTWIQWM